ncbi:MAG: hypothetical protein ACOC3W_09625 [Thermodesulfobacteriota bacterium]
MDEMQYDGDYAKSECTAAGTPPPMLVKELVGRGMFGPPLVGFKPIVRKVSLFSILTLPIVDISFGFHPNHTLQVPLAVTQHIELRITFLPYHPALTYFVVFFLKTVLRIPGPAAQ